VQPDAASTVSWHGFKEAWQLMAASLETNEQPQGDGGAEPATGILFLCMARDCARTLPVFFTYLKQLDGNRFACSAIIGENGSSDATRSLIEQAAGPRIALLDTAFMANAASRLGRMAVGRQALADAALARGFREEFVCVADLDNVMAAPPPPGAVRAASASLRSNPYLFAVGATSRPVYYDLLSLRAEGFEFLENLSCEIEAAKRRPWSYYRFHQNRIYRIQQRMTGCGPVLCASSFNGFCLYRARDYRLGSYRAPDEAKVCEHVSFNCSIARGSGKRMMISPHLAVQAPMDHTPVGFLRFWADRLGERL
jgi:hypothetical protein